jgi:DNA polymerase-3 subunit beta
MKVICDRSALLQAVNLVAAVVPPRTPSPALSCLKITAAKHGSAGVMTIVGTDAETSISLSLTQVDVTQGGSVTVPAHKLQQVVSAVDDTDPTVTLELDGEVCHIRGSHTRFKIFTQSGSDFPPIPEFPTGTVAAAARAIFSHHAGSLLRMINTTVFATAKETSRYAINGVLMKRDGKKLEMVATDGRRLALARTTIKGDKDKEGAGAVSCIIPTKALNLFARLAHDPEAPVRIALTENRVFFAFDEASDSKKDEHKTPRAVMSSALVEGAFPPYEDVIPKDSDKKVTAGRDDLARAVRQAGILTNEESRGVRLSFDAKAKRLRLSSRAPEMGESEVDLALTAYDGESVEISFNPQYIGDALKAIDEPEVIMELKAPNKPGVLKAGNDFVYVVMPVSLPQ